MAAETQGATTFKHGVLTTLAVAGTTAVEIQSISVTKTPEITSSTQNEGGVVSGERVDDVTLEVDVSFQADAVPTDALGDVISVSGSLTGSAAFLLIGKTESYQQDAPAVFSYKLRKRSAITHS